MLNNKNVFFSTNPTKMNLALLKIMQESQVDFSDMLIFLPSRRAVRGVEKMLVENSKVGAVILPRLVALGEGIDDTQEAADFIISDTERLIILAKLLAADANVASLSNALPLAHDLITLQDYLENEGVKSSDIDWYSLVEEKYAKHFQNKAKILALLNSFMKNFAENKLTEAERKNKEIRNWIKYIQSKDFDKKLVIVCGSTASVAATAELMAFIAGLNNGRIILSGKISGSAEDFALPTNPYNSENKFLNRIGLSPQDLMPIDVGESEIDFFNLAFSNSVDGALPVPKNCTLIECAREAEEANVCAEISSRAINEGKSVLVITPDAAGNQRIKEAFIARGITGDFSGGQSGKLTNIGRGLLNYFDNLIDKRADKDYEALLQKSNNSLFELVLSLVENENVQFSPAFDAESEESISVLKSIKDFSDKLLSLGIIPSLTEARLFIAEALSNVSIREISEDEKTISVLGTMEARMQTANVVILTGLNENMFPMRGYENNWMTRNTAEKIGLPSPERKVSLMSLDFMTLSCNKEVYWLRSKVSGGVQTTESRFLSRVLIRGFKNNDEIACDILKAVRKKDELDLIPLDYSAPVPPADWSDVYVTELELLIHNPYAFYVKHILRLKPLDDYWQSPDARHFGILVHDVIENTKELNTEKLVAEMDRKAKEILGETSIIFHFWHKRFLEIAPVVVSELSSFKDKYAEIVGQVNIEGRNIKARADLVWDGGVLDIKTGKAPTENQLLEGNMPQLPLEAYILQNKGFSIPMTEKSLNPVLKFLQLKNGDVRQIVYEAEKAEQMINASVEKAKELVHIFSVGQAPYEYRETNEKKYQVYDDLARKFD